MNAGRTSLWDVAYDPLRAFFLLRGLCLLLAIDLCFDMVEHGGRYGIGEFNVAHFALLDRWLPLPTATLYVGLLILSAGLALQIALGGAARALRFGLFASYTSAWLISVHDAYQHHYLLSWLLLWAACMPYVTLRRALDREPLSGWALPMTSLSCAVVYSFTAVSKSEPLWRSGDVMRVLTHSKAPGDEHPGKFDGLRDLTLQLGLTDRQFWQAIALSTIALQCVIALAYMLAPRRDAQPSRTRVFLVTLGLLGALSFHATAELFHVFEIGLFSYYMMAMAWLLLAPAVSLTPLAGLLARSQEQLLAWWSRARGRVRLPSVGARPIELLVVPLFVLLAVLTPLPGAPWAGSTLAAVALSRQLWVWRRSPRERGSLALQLALTALALWSSLALSPVPFDFYRRTGGELARMGLTEQAIDMYKRGERYAPRGRSRAKKIRELEAELSARRDRESRR